MSAEQMTHESREIVYAFRRARHFVPIAIGRYREGFARLDAEAAVRELTTHFDTDVLDLVLASETLMLAERGAVSEGNARWAEGFRRLLDTAPDSVQAALDLSYATQTQPTELFDTLVTEYRRRLEAQ